MNKLLITLLILGFAGVAYAGYYFDSEPIMTDLGEQNLGATVCFPYQGCTGIGTVPVYGQMLVGTSGGVYQLMATSSLGITGGTGAVSFGGLQDTATSSDATGDVYYLNSSGQIVNLGIGGADTVLKVSGGLPSWGTDTTGSGVGTVSTSTTPTHGQLSYWTSAGAYPETLGTIATTTLTATSPLALSNPISVIGGSASILTMAVSGDWTGTFDGQQGIWYQDANNLTDFGTPFYTYFNATSTDALSVGSTNLYATQAVWDTHWNASSTLTSPTSIPNLAFANDAIDEVDISFSTVCASGNHYYLSGTDLACEADANTTYTAGTNLLLTGTTFSASSELLTWTSASSTYMGIATTSVDSIATLANLSITKSQVSDFGTYENPLTFNYPLSRATNAISLSDMATTSLTATSPLSLSQPISVIGSSASALSLSTAGDWTGTIDSNNFAGGAIGTGELIYGGSAGSFSELVAGTNGNILSMSGGIPAWIATTTFAHLSADNVFTGTATTTMAGNLDVAGDFEAGGLYINTAGQITAGEWRGTKIDISDFTNLTAGRSLTLTGDDILADAPLYTYEIWTSNVGSSTMATTTGTFLQKRIANASTITSVACWTNSGTSTIEIEERDFATPNTAGTDILFAGGLVCGSGTGNTASTTVANASIDATDIINLEITDSEPTGDAPTIIYFSIIGTK